jgi:intracellular septation protein
MNSSLVWFGFLPVLAFLVMDAYAGKRKALWGALALGAVEVGYTVAVFGAMDYLSVLAFLILGLFVWISLRTEDDFFFKIHGAVINFVLAAVMLVAFYFFHRALLLDVAEKYIGLDKLVAMNPKLDREIVGETFRILSYQLPLWLVLHSLLTIYAAANWGKWAWAFVRVPGFIFMLVLASGFAQSALIKDYRPPAKDSAEDPAPVPKDAPKAPATEL